MREGVFLVSTASHGGVMVRRNAADFLSPEARKVAINERNYLCYEGGCDEAVVVRELLDKKLWVLPERMGDKARYEDSIDQSLQRWRPEYWQARQKAVQAISEAVMPDARRDIIFRDHNYKEAFRIKDGDSIKITVAYDGEEIVRKCRFLDEYHMNVGSSCYHMDEFMEKMKKVGNTYEQIPGQAPMLDIVVAEPGKAAIEAVIPLSHAALRELVGGEPEIASKDKFTAVIRGANGNGTVAAFGINGDSLTSLHPYDAQKHRRELAAELPPVKESKPPSLSERLEAGRIKAAEHNAARAAPAITGRKAAVEVS
jgi:hypothetical protein